MVWFLGGWRSICWELRWVGRWVGCFSECKAGAEELGSLGARSPSKISGSGSLTGISWRYIRKQSSEVALDLQGQEGEEMPVLGQHVRESHNSQTWYFVEGEGHSPGGRHLPQLLASFLKVGPSVISSDKDAGGR